MEIVALILFIAMVASWVVLPGSTMTKKAKSSEMAPAAAKQTA
jgi:hypothetical protein